MDFKKPVITDNRNLRKKVPEINNFFEEAEKELAGFPRENNIIVDPKIVEFVNCPICRNSNASQLFVKYGFIYAECNECSHVFVQNRIKEDVLLGLYSESTPDKLDRKIKTSSQHLDYWGKIHQKYLSYVSEHGSKNPNMIDIGCGAGTFLRNAKKLTNMKLHGLDFCEDTFESIIELIGKNNYFYRTRIQDIDFGGKKFGLISLWGVLEHLVDPVEVMQSCASILDDDGIMILLIPNPNSRAIQILGVATPTLHPRGHITLCTEQSFNNLCGQCGLKVLERFQELPVIDLMHPYISYSDKLIDELVERQECYYDVYVVGKE